MVGASSVSHFFRQRLSLHDHTALFTALCICLSLAASLQAQSLAAPSLPGWNKGLVLSGRDVSYSSPNVADLDHDASNGLEVVVGSAEGTLYAYHGDGTLFWTASLPNTACPIAVSDRLLSSPAVGDLFGNGTPYVVVGYGGLSRDCDGGVAAYRGSDGSRAWTFSIKNFSKRNHFWAFRYGVFSSPALADVDNDGRLEIGFGAFDRNVYLLNANGKPRWYYNAADTVWSSPAFLDVNQDGRMEMIIGTDISANQRLRPPTPDGGYLYAFKTGKRRQLQIRFRDPSAYAWLTAVDQVLYSSPAVGDVLPGSPGDEIVIASGCFFPQRTSNKCGRWLKVIRASDGKILNTLNTPACSSSTPALADINGDGQLEVVATISGNARVGGDGLGRVMAWKADQSTPLWVTIPRMAGDNDDYLGDFKSPVIADLDGNGSVEVVVANSNGLVILAGATGLQLTCASEDCSAHPLRLGAARYLRATPAIADVNGDGVLDVIAAGGSVNRSHGGIQGWTYFTDLLGSAPGTFPPFYAPWPMFRSNSRHSGRAE